MESSAFFPGEPCQLITALESLGHSAWFVGGCVRDALLGRLPDDFDIATSATPGEVQTLPFTTIPTGLKHGTVTVLAGETRVEVTTYRADGPYRDGRRPESVRFSQRIEEDLIRRDFTVNAMALHPRRGLLDITGGQADLADRLIRCVGDPFLRLQEDALRILRAIRLAAALGFTLEENTWRAMRACAPSLIHIAAERIFTEWAKLLPGPFAGQTLQRYASLLPAFLPVDSQMVQIIDDWTPIDTLPPSLALRFSYVCCRLCPGQTPKAGATMLRRLKAPNDLTRRVERLLSLLAQSLPPDALSMRRWLNKNPPAIVREHLHLRGVLQTDPPGSLAHAFSLLESEKGACVSLAQLAVKGADLLALGYPPGKPLGVVLEQLLRAVMEDRLPNLKKSLLQYAEKLLNNGGIASK